jgi:hypothetical protein
MTDNRFKNLGTRRETKTNDSHTPPKETKTERSNYLRERREAELPFKPSQNIYSKVLQGTYEGTVKQAIEALEVNKKDMLKKEATFIKNHNLTEKEIKAIGRISSEMIQQCIDILALYPSR